MKSKSFCEDLTEGKFSFPIIHAIHSNPKDTRLTSILRQKTEDIDVKKHAVSYMIQCGSLEYTRNRLKELKAQVLKEISLLGGHEVLVSLIEKLDAQIYAVDE